MSIAVSASGAKGRFRDGQSAGIGQDQPYNEVADSGRSMELSTRSRHTRRAKLVIPVGGIPGSCFDPPGEALI
jgi:hypothetical protein